ncbi:MAG: zinc-ribbon domain-containing protein [Myxococcaceae bacterium]|nr:zinc-ribbon domain-containing protein [Myxococcaceae bacterium]
MDVRCPRCQSEYELDEARVTDDGVTVKCSECQHVFRVKKKSLVMTLPVREDQAIASAPLPPTAGHREWRVRQPNGNTYLCRELTTLQKWIIEGKVTRDDEISLTGETWKRLGDIPELASFFQVVEDAAKGRAYEAIRASQVDLPAITPQVLANQGKGLTDTWKEPRFSVPPPPPAPSVPPPEPLKETIKGPAFSTPLPPEPKPLPRPPPPPEPIDEKELEKAVGGGGMKWAVLIFGGLLIGGGAGYYFGFYEPEQKAKAEAERVAKERAAAAAAEEARVKAEQEAARQKAEDEARQRALEAAQADAGADGGADAGVEVDAGVVVDAGVTVDAGVKAVASGGGPPPGKSYDYYLERGDALRDAEKPQAALNFYGKAADLKPDRVEPVVGRGFALFDMGQMLQAEASFEQALRINSKYGPAIMGMAEVQKAQGKKAKAIEYYQRYLDEHPTGSEANVAKNAIERLK